jgi:hypothetical protein
MRASRLVRPGLALEHLEERNVGRAQGIARDLL